jgi:Ca-activated chloride channel family protein
MIATAAHADSFRSRLKKGNAFLKSGDAESALREYEDLKTEDPENKYLYYNMGRAYYKSGESEMELNSPEDAINSFKSAKTNFDKAANSPVAELSRQAQFNAATCGLRLGEQLSKGGKYQEAVDSYRSAIEQYQALLAKNPNNEAAKKNLDYAQYQLKRMLQNPPPPPEKQQQQQQQDQKDQKDQQQDQQQNQKDQQQGQQEQQKDQPQQDQQQQEQKQAEQQQGQDQQKQEAQQQQGQQAAAAQQDQQNQQGQAKQDKDEEHQNADALLQSLEDVDKREQKEVRNQRTSVDINKNWW